MTPGPTTKRHWHDITCKSKRENAPTARAGANPPFRLPGRTEQASPVSSPHATIDHRPSATPHHTTLQYHTTPRLTTPHTKPHQATTPHHTTTHHTTPGHTTPPHHHHHHHHHHSASYRAVSMGQCPVHHMGQCPVHPMGQCPLHPTRPCPVHPVGQSPVHPMMLDGCSLISPTFPICWPFEKADWVGGRSEIIFACGAPLRLTPCAMRPFGKNKLGGPTVYNFIPRGAQNEIDFGKRVGVRLVRNATF